MAEELKEILQQRGAAYGRFCDQARISQNLKTAVNDGLLSNPQFTKLPPAVQDVIREGIDMILHKVSRLANGDPTFKDSWDDIAGYATITIRDILALLHPEIEEGAIVTGKIPSEAFYEAVGRAEKIAAHDFGFTSTTAAHHQV